LGKVREAVILAAGLGTRLRTITNNVPKFLLRIKGKPLITYPMHSLMKIGIKRFIIVVSKGWGNEVSNVISKSIGHYADLEIVENPEVERENGYSLILGSRYVNDEYFILSMSDHIYVPQIPYKLIELSSRLTNEVIMAVGADRDPKYVDVSEATKIDVDDDGYVRSIGKSIANYKYVDVGVFLVSRRIKDLEHQLLKSYTIRVSDIVNMFVKLGYKVLAVDVTGYPWTEVDTPRDLDELINGYRSVVLDYVRRSIEVGISWS